MSEDNRFKMFYVAPNIEDAYIYEGDFLDKEDRLKFNSDMLAAKEKADVLSKSIDLKEKVERTTNKASKLL